LVLLVVAGCNDNNGTTVTTPPAASGLVARTDIVTDATDSNLVNAWGLAFNPAGVAWVSANGSGLSEVYDANGGHVIGPITVPVPAGATPPSAPTGQAFNGNPSAFLGDVFIFVTEDGTISGWQPSDGTTAGSSAMLRVDNSASGAVYKGVALGTATDGTPRLYAANFNAGTVDMFDGMYHPMAAAFMDPQLPAGFAPFNVAVVQGAVLVSYAMQNAAKHDDVAGAGNGFVNLFDGNGTLLGRLLSGGELNSPWGMTISPSTFAAAPDRLLVGNFGDGLVHFYTFDINTRTATSVGTLNGAAGAPMTIDGLWALQFGPGTGGFATDTLFFTAGPGMEMHGVFGRLNTTTGVTIHGISP
jgi:uncharacterized protein (TIGR03118 family)